jgi:putative ABC transport system ATP-binding protein
MSDKVLAVDDVVKVFEEGSQRVEVLRGVSLSVKPGEVLALEGPSGSGKTTLLSIMGCILSPTSGKVTVAGREVEPHRPERLREVRRRSIGFVFQQYNLFPALTALENVEYALNVKGVRGQAAEREAARALDQVGLEDRKAFLPRDLSGGQKQRVAIARALAGSPQVLLADEPTANLDSATGETIVDLMREMNRRDGTTFIFSTHDPKVMSHANAIIRIADGRIAAREAIAAAGGR